MAGVIQIGDRDLADGPTDCGLLRRPRADRLRDLVRWSTAGMGISVIGAQIMCLIVGL
jgi:hypothetical protein